MDKARQRALIRTVKAEIISSLPRRRKITNSFVPDDPLDMEPEGIYTSAFTNGRKLRIWEFTLGATMWLGWIFIGIYFWWFTEVPTSDYVIGTTVWTIIFLFSLLGIPVVRAIMEIKNKI